MIKRSRTTNSMTPFAKSRALRLWEVMQDTLDDKEHAIARDKYHAMFKVDSNFLPNTASYKSGE